MKLSATLVALASASLFAGSTLGAACAGNTATTRAQWCDYDINDDYYNDIPDTGVTVEYWFDIVNITLAPDGYSRQVQAVNGTIPGPTIEANWGDTVVVHVTNSVVDNGTSIHFHGVRQNYTNQQDGVSAITQCPTAPGDSITYSWVASEYGTSWYHSHYSLQAWDGVFGPIVVNGPASANYDHDAGTIFLSDWTHETVDYLYHEAQIVGPITLDNGLINGVNTYNGGGSRYETTFTSGDSYLLRVINGAIDTHFDFSIDNHTLLVISTDFVPIEPYYTDFLSIGMGQRYDVVVVANQSAVASDFWMRAVPEAFCSANANSDDIRGIIHYGSSTGTPTTSQWDYPAQNCTGEPLASQTPVVSKTVGALAASTSGAVTVGPVGGLFKWYIGDQTFNASWADPTAKEILDGTTFAAEEQVFFAPNAGEWYTIILDTSFAAPHPIHLHGHDFFVLAADEGTYDDSVALNYNNPPRRDVQMLPANGYLVMAFQADNPGAWLVHCHIGWHTEEGLSLQVIELEDQIAATYDQTALENTCNNWNAYVERVGKTQEDDDGI